MNVSTNTQADTSVLRGEWGGGGGGPVSTNTQADTSVLRGEWGGGACIDEHSGRYKCTER